MAMNVRLLLKSLTKIITNSDGTTKAATEEWTGINGAASVYGLASNAVKVTATAYSATEILGFHVIAPGSGNWTVTPLNGSAIILAPGGFTAGQVYPEHLSAITVGTGGEALVYIP